MSSSRLISCVLVLSAVAGCRTTAPTMESTGEPLEVRTHIVKHDGYFDSRDDWVKPGEFVVFDGFYQGEKNLEDEVNFYHVAGDAEHEAGVIDWHQRFNNSLVGTWVINGVSAVLVGTGAALLASGANGEGGVEGYVGTTPGQVAVGLLAGGGILFGANFLIADALLGPETRSHTENDYELVYTLETAYETEKSYNEGRATTTTEPAAELSTSTETP